MAQNQTAVHHQTRSFLIIWAGQLVSLIGSGLTSFALSVWVYQQTGSATQLALVTLCFHIGIVVMSPIAGPLVDRWNRRWAMIVGDSGSAVSTLLIALLFTIGKLEIWHIYLAVATNAAFRAIQWPAYSSAITLLVPKEELGRANGLVQLGRGIGEIASPVIAGVLVVSIQLEGVILVDFVTFLFALVTLLVIRVPETPQTAETELPQDSFIGNSMQGWVYIWNRPGLLGLLVFMAVVGFQYGIALVLFMPLVLGFASETTLGTVMSIGSTGMFVGGALMSIWGGPKRKVYGVLGPGVLMGLGLLLIGLRPNPFFITVAMFTALSTIPLIAGSEEAIWQNKVAPAIQGRVFAVRNTVTTAVLPVASLIAGPLADFVFEPLLAADGPLRGSIGRVIGVGPGRGIAFLFIVLGILTALLSVGSFLFPRIQLVEDELPDALLETPVEPVKQQAIGEYA